MRKTKGYDYILDGSNIIYENKLWGDKKTELEGEKFYAINLHRLESAVEYFEKNEYKVLICIDYSTTKKNTKYFTTSKNKFNKFIKEKNVVKIQGDYELIKFKSENPKSKIVTNDTFLNWINGKEVVPELTKDDWKREKLERQEFGFREGDFTTARKNNKFTKTEELTKRQSSKVDLGSNLIKNSNSTDKIHSRLQSLDEQVEEQIAKINNVNNLVQNITSLVDEIIKSSTQNNSTALIPCKFEDEYGQTHLCLLGNNLKMWKESGWIEITAE
tara:strand:- start:1776 stop:2594 length:819 start_codon:yes stop_codon:yes gene_type:complete